MEKKVVCEPLHTMEYHNLWRRNNRNFFLYR